ncbi:unnamed protein product [Effrenium voratum]|nr:unnamed protein product [Effrenium voratum]
MPHTAFFRQDSNDSAMEPLREQEETLYPQMAAHVERRTKAGQAKLQPARNQPQRQLWADITTDDEDTFPSWSPSSSRKEQQSKVLTETSEKGLSWDPLGLGSSDIADVLWNKMSSAGASPQNKAIFDKWSTATRSAETLAETEHTDEAGSVSEFSTTEASQTDESVEQAPPQKMVMPMPLPMQPVPMLQVPQVQQVQQVTMQVPMQQMQMQAPMQVQQRVMVAVPMPPMHPGMGMMPFMPMSGPNGMNVMPNSMLNFQYPAQQQAQSWQQEQEESILSTGPPVGKSHRFHQKSSCMGVLSSDARTFTKRYNKGRLSIISENKVHFQGSVRYAVQFTDGELCSADGVGFILSSDLPCTRNIQKIVSIFANRTGRICVRVHDEVERCQERVKCLEIGDWLEVGADLVNQTVSFTVWPQDGSAPSFATVSFKEILKQARGKVSGLPRNPCGFLAVVVKHLGVSVSFGS